MNAILTIITNGLFTILALIPLGVMRPVAKLIAFILWISHSEARRVTQQNLRICFPDKSEIEREHIAKQRMQHLSMMALELAASWCWPSEKLIKSMETPQEPTLLDDLVAGGKGVILLAPHHGNWEALGPYLGSRHPLVCLYQPPKIAAVDKLVLKSRERYAKAMAPTNATGVKMLLKSLKRGEVVAILPDQVPPAGGGEFAPFFGTPALTMTLVYNLIQRTGAAAVISYAKRIEGSKHFQVIFREVPPELFSSDLNCSIKALNECVERVVLECPEQYQWEYKRFKRQPDGKKRYQ